MGLTDQIFLLKFLSKCVVLSSSDKFRQDPKHLPLERPSKEWSKLHREHHPNTELQEYAVLFMGQWMWQHKSNAKSSEFLEICYVLSQTLSVPPSWRDVCMQVLGTFPLTWRPRKIQRPVSTVPWQPYRDRIFISIPMPDDRQVINCVQSYHSLFIYHDSLLWLLCG